MQVTGKGQEMKSQQRSGGVKALRFAWGIPVAVSVLLSTAPLGGEKSKKTGPVAENWAFDTPANLSTYEYLRMLFQLQWHDHESSVGAGKECHRV